MACCKPNQLIEIARDVLRQGATFDAWVCRKCGGTSIKTHPPEGKTEPEPEQGRLC